MRTRKNKVQLPLTTDNFRRICALNRMTPGDCIARSGKSKITVYAALRNPKQFGPTIRRLEELLPEREVESVQA